MPYLNEMAMVALYSHIANGEGGVVLVVAPGRWEVMQIRAEIRASFLRSKLDRDEMFDLDAGGCRIILYFGRLLPMFNFALPKGAARYSLVLLVGAELDPKLSSHLSAVGSLEFVVDCGG